MPRLIQMSFMLRARSVNSIVTAKPMYLPIVAEPAVTRPMTAVSRGADDWRNPSQQQPYGYVYRGELLEAAGDRQYRPRENLHINPENRRAIASYQKIASEQTVIGLILDGFI